MARLSFRLAEIDLNDDKAGKPVGIHQVIGRRPTIAFGNSDGDFEMLEWTTSAKGPRLGVIVHHTDAEREWAYDRDSHRTTRARPGRGSAARLGHRRHEERLERHLSDALTQAAFLRAALIHGAAAAKNQMR